MVRIDMSEYQEKHAVSRLIGAPPGYVGYDEAGQLTEAVRRRPYAVVLFDEIEKAHPEVLNVLLQLLDDGRLTDGRGRTVDFKNTVVIMTSNLGSQYLAERALRDGTVDEGDAARGARGHAPAFPARVHQPHRRDDRVPPARARAHGPDHRPADGAAARPPAGAEDHAAPHRHGRQLLVDEGYDPLYGARPLKRTLQKRVLDPLAMQVLQGEFREGDEVTLDVVDGALRFEKRQAVVH